MAWYEIALLIALGIVFVWFTFFGDRGTSAVKVLLAPLELLVVPLRAIHRLSKDETQPRVVQLLARLAMKFGSAVLFVLCLVGTVLYLFRRSLPRLWH